MNFFMNIIPDYWKKKEKKKFHLKNSRWRFNDNKMLSYNILTGFDGKDYPW